MIPRRLNPMVRIVRQEPNTEPRELAAGRDPATLAKVGYFDLTEAVGTSLRMFQWTGPRIPQRASEAKQQ